jgi:hypothetical protein
MFDAIRRIAPAPQEAGIVQGVSVLGSPFSAPPIKNHPPSSGADTRGDKLGKSLEVCVDCFGNVLGGTRDLKIVRDFVGRAGGIRVHVSGQPFSGVVQAHLGEGVFDLPSHKPLETFFFAYPELCRTKA